MNTNDILLYLLFNILFGVIYLLVNIDIYTKY